MFDCGWLRWVLCMRKGLVIFYFSFVEDDGGKVLYGDSVKIDLVASFGRWSCSWRA